MKHVYNLVTTLFVTLSIMDSASAQTFTGGTYTARTSGNWHVASGPNIWAPSEPPSTCNNCEIIINSGVSVTLNTSVTLNHTSLLQIGTDPSQGAATLTISASNGADFASSANVIVSQDGSSPENAIFLFDATSTIDASAADLNFDGIFTTFNGTTPITFFKQIGNGASTFFGTTAINNRPPASNTLAGTSRLSSSGTLPVSLIDFEATKNSDGISLSWTTTEEVNSGHFEIERSSNGGAKWDSIGSVAAQGFSELPVNYSYTDASATASVNEYRLRIVDRDGKYAYSGVKIVRAEAVASLKVFPNPTSDNVFISFPAASLNGSNGENTGSYTIRLLNQTGQVLASRTVDNAAGTTVTLPVSSYPLGNYLILIAGADGTRQTSKLLIAHQ